MSALIKIHEVRPVDRVIKVSPQRICFKRDEGDRVTFWTLLLGANTERFCPQCLAGVESDQHHGQCVVTGHAIDGEPAPKGQAIMHDEGPRASAARAIAERQAAARTAETTAEKIYRQRADTAEDAIARICEIHAPINAVHYQGKKQTLRQVCTGCGTDNGNWQIWPCPTIRALEGDGS